MATAPDSSSYSVSCLAAPKWGRAGGWSLTICVGYPELALKVERVFANPEHFSLEAWRSTITGESVIGAWPLTVTKDDLVIIADTDLGADDGATLDLAVPLAALAVPLAAALDEAERRGWRFAPAPDDQGGRPTDRPKTEAPAAPIRMSDSTPVVANAPVPEWVVECAAESEDAANGDWQLRLWIRVPGGLFLEYIEYEPYEYSWAAWDRVVRGDAAIEPMLVQEGSVVLRVSADSDSHHGVYRHMVISVPHAALAPPLAAALADARRRGLVTQDIKWQ